MATQTHAEITQAMTTNGDHGYPAKTALKVVFGAMTVGEEGKYQGILSFSKPTSHVSSSMPNWKAIFLTYILQVPRVPVSTRLGKYLTS